MRVIGPILRAYRRRELARRYPNGKVSPRFRHIEFWTKDGTPIPIRALPGLERMCRLVLEPMRAKFGACSVHSGYRHATYNARIGGASDSRHVWDKRPLEIAVDLSFARGNVEQWAREAERLLKAHGIGGGVGRYLDDRFVHVDLRPHAERW